MMSEYIYYNDLNKLIIDYIACAKYSCSLLKQAYAGQESFLRAKVLKLIPREGTIEGVFYKFHGSGCYFEYPNNHIDIDFGPNDRCDGFDLFKLKDFLFSIKDRNKYHSLEDEKKIENQFAVLDKNGIIYNPKTQPNPHLYYIR
jgi:hypothetical protein